MAAITINGITLDPETHGPALSAFGFGQPNVQDTDYVIIQLDGPATAAQRAALTAAGAKLLEYVQQNSYLAQFPGANLSPITALPFVRLATRYMKGFKVHPALVAAEIPDPVSVLSMEGGSNVLRSHQANVHVVLHKGANVPAALAEIGKVVGADPAQMTVTGRRVALSINSSRLQPLADLDVVRHIEPQPRNALFNNVAGQILRADAVHAGVAGLPGLDGQGQVVAVCDTGFDKGDPLNTHAAFTGRVRRLVAMGRAVANDPQGHGTHVCGSILGSDVVAGLPIRGTAPAAELVLQSVLSDDGGLGGIPDDLKTLFDDPYSHDGARVHSNSWGDSNPSSHRQYDGQAFDVDSFVHTHRNMVVVFAAGNDGADGNRNGVVDEGSVSPPGTAKNCITVGASESERAGSRSYGSFRPTSYPKSPLRDDLSADNRNGLAAFSSRGTTLDGRIKPDIVAPGTSILSTLSRDAQLETTFGSHPPPGYMFDTGTSMATPLVAGCAAVVRQHLIRDRGVADPSAALVKAMLINGATPLLGQYVPSEAGVPPNADQGFGRVDVAASVAPTLVLHDEGAALADTGDQAAFNAVVGPSGGLKITLVWTDPPGSGLQNDLDLVVTVGAQSAHGNLGVGATGFDRTNNVEQVVWTGLQPGAPAAIEVRAHRIALQGQSFALVIRAD